MGKKLRIWTNMMCVVGIVFALLSIVVMNIPNYSSLFIQISLSASGVTLTVTSVLLKIFVLHRTTNIEEIEEE